MKLFLVIILFLPFVVEAQIDRNAFEKFKHTNTWFYLTSEEKQDVEHILEIGKFKFHWLNQADPKRKVMLESLIQQLEFTMAEQFRTWLDSLRLQKVNLKNVRDSINAELRLISISAMVLRRIMTGVVPQLSYNGLVFQSRSKKLPEQLITSISNGTLPVLFNGLNDSPREIAVILKMLHFLKGKINDTIFRQDPVKSTEVSVSNKELLYALSNLGCINLSGNMQDSVIKNAVKDAQRMFDQYPDGKLKVATLRELNTPIQTRYRQLLLALGMYRWLADVSSDERAVVVNIPSAMLHVYYKNEILLAMKMVVGDPITPTPTLSSRIQEVILYPYWQVPYSIATKELLPKIQKDAGFLERQNLQVMNLQGKAVDPRNIAWSKVNAADFPYVLRQSTGCDNALGLLKLNFHNPFSVYLHDTPYKTNFLLAKRFYSHGCMRMERPMELGRMLLGFNRIAIDTLEEKGCLRNQRPIVVKAQHQIPVIVWYNPVSLDAAGRIVFHYDIYRKLNWTAIRQEQESR